MANPDLDLLARPIPAHLVTDELRPLDDVLDELAIYWAERDAEERRLEHKAGADNGWDWDAEIDGIAEPVTLTQTGLATDEDCPF
jgi:hypothetical protein